jgi:hypothetical protein
MAANKTTALEALARVEAQTAAFSKALHETMKEDLDLLKDYIANSERKPTVIAVRPRHSGKAEALTAAIEAGIIKKAEDSAKTPPRVQVVKPFTTPPIIIPYDEPIKNSLDDKINATAKSEAEAAGEKIAAALRAELDFKFGEISAKIDSNDAALQNRLNALEEKTDCVTAKHEHEINELKRKAEGR